MSEEQNSCQRHQNRGPRVEGLILARGNFRMELSAWCKSRPDFSRIYAVQDVFEVCAAPRAPNRHDRSPAMAAPPAAQLAHARAATAHRPPTTARLLAQQLLCYLGVSELGALASVSTSMRADALDDLLWEPLLARLRMLGTS